MTNTFRKHARLRIALDSGFPYTDVDVFAEDAEFRGFPHQDAETGKLCLLSERDAPRCSSRLKVYLQWAREWLNDAASKNLLKAGDPFELPDFSRHQMGDGLPTDLSLLFEESATKLPFWNQYVGKYGRVEVAPPGPIRGLLATLFYNKDGGVITRTQYGNSLVDPRKLLTGYWILLPSLFYYRHRPPQTFGELDKMCSGYDLSFYSILRFAWEHATNTLALRLF